MTIPTLATERLELAQPRQDHLAAIVQLANDYEVAKTLGRMPHPYRLSDAQFFLNEVVPKEPNWQIARKVDAVLLGFVGLKPITDDVVELGYWLGREFWGQGYATEAASAIVAHTFVTRNIETILSGHFTSNPASGRVLEKLGFSAYGRSERFSSASNQTLPHIDLKLTRNQWRATHADIR